MRVLVAWSPTIEPGVTEKPIAVDQALGTARPAMSARRLILPLALAQFICSFAGSNMNVMINDITEDLDTTVRACRPRSLCSF